MSDPAASSNSFKNILFSFSLLALACSLTYFGYALIRVIEQIPKVLEQLDKTSMTVEPITAQIPDVLETVNQVSATIPSVVEEAKAYRQLVPEILAEVKTLRETLPEVLSRVDAIDTRVQEVNAQLPSILDTADSAVLAVNQTNQTVKEVVPLVPDVLDEVEKTRAEIPGYITRVEQVVASAKDISEEAGKGAVKGVLKGIITTPFDFLAGAEKSIMNRFKGDIKLTEEDAHFVTESIKVLLSDESINRKTWSNEETGNHGRVDVLKRYQGAEGKCVSLSVVIETGDEEQAAARDVCQDASGRWAVVE